MATPKFESLKLSERILRDVERLNELNNTYTFDYAVLSNLAIAHKKIDKVLERLEADDKRNIERKLYPTKMGENKMS